MEELARDQIKFKDMLIQISQVIWIKGDLSLDMFIPCVVEQSARRHLYNQ